MINKNIFPDQDVPLWVKDMVMNKIKASPKKFRLLYMIRYKFVVPVAVCFLLAIGGYIYFYKGNDKTIVVLNKSGYQNSIYTGNIISGTTAHIQDKRDTTNTTLANEENGTTDKTDELLQQKLAEAELILNDLSDHLNKEEDIFI